MDMGASGRGRLLVILGIGAFDYTFSLADEGDKLRKRLRDNFYKNIGETVGNYFVESSAKENNRSIVVELRLRLEYVLIGEEDIKVFITLSNNKKNLLGNIFLVNISESNYKNTNNFVIIFEVNNTIRTYSILDLLVNFILEYRKVIAYFILLVFKIIYIMVKLELDFLKEIL
jgi:hypothetical protein